MPFTDTARLPFWARLCASCAARCVFRWAQVLLRPTLMACVHCIFGFSLIGLLSLLMGAADFALFAGGTVVFTLVVLGLYYLVTIAVCERTLVSAS